MKINGFFHIHSTYSDGQLNLAELKEFFAKEGSSVIFVTEHAEELTPQQTENFIADCQKSSDKKFLIIPGFEIKYGLSHILVVGPSRYLEDQNLLEVFKKYKNDGCLIVWAHPLFKGKKFINEEMIGLLDGCEIWNSLYDGKYCPRPASIFLLENLRGKNSHIFGYAGLDLHRLSHANGPWLEIQIQEFTITNIADSLKNGNFIIKKNKLEIKPIGEMSEEKTMALGIISFFSVNFIRFFKTISAIFAKLGIKPPEKIKEQIRKKI